MTEKEVGKVLLWLEMYYPMMNELHKNGPDGDRMKEKVKAWHDMLYPVKRSDASKILKKYVKSEQRPPTIADIMTIWNRHNSGKDMEEWRKKHEKR